MIPRNQCLFCGSRNCHLRIYTEDLQFDEVACYRHISQLEEHSDNVLGAPGKLRWHISGTSKQARSKPVSYAI